MAKDLSRYEIDELLEDYNFDDDDNSDNSDDEELDFTEEHNHIPVNLEITKIDKK